MTYKFPDEQDEFDKKPDVELEVTAEDDVVEADIVIEDDTPEQDRKAQPLNREVEDPTDEEIDGYTKGVQSRIKELTHARHDDCRSRIGATDTDVTDPRSRRPDPLRRVLHAGEAGGSPAGP